MSHDILYFLRDDASAGKVMAHASQLLKLSRQLTSLLPGKLGASARVANLKDGRLVVHADNGAVAAKIRQMEMRLCTELKARGAPCTAIEVRVQPREKVPLPPPPRIKPLSMKTRTILRSTVESLPKGGLRLAMDELLARAASDEAETNQAG